MKCIYLFLPLLCFSLCGAVKRCSNLIKPIKMTVLYESLCPSSQEFIKNLKPVFQDYHSCIKLNLVPYGKARQTKHGLKCQHGTAECWGNKMQNCALHSNLNQLEKVQFVSCQMKNQMLTKLRDFKCAKSLKITKKVKHCLKPSGKGEIYQAEAARITNRYGFSEIPAIIYNGVFNEALQKPSRFNTRQTICKILVKSKHLLPSDC